jgi:hypothetical protein
MKVSRGLVSVLVLFFILPGCWSGESYEEKQAKEKQEREAAMAKKEAQRTQTITEFSNTYNADTTWQKSLEGKPLATLELQNALIRQDGRPIVAATTLLDVEKDGERYKFHLNVHDTERYVMHEHLLFELSCSAPNMIFKFPQPFMPPIAWSADYLVAARMESVKPAFHWQNSESDKGQAGFDVLQKQFIATGECLGLKFIGEDDPMPSKGSPVSTFKFPSELGGGR